MASTRPKPEKGRLDLPEIKKLIEMIERSPITEFELVDRDLKIRISKNEVHHNIPPLLQTATLPPAVAPSFSAQPSPQAEGIPTIAKSRQVFEVKAPMVGTFYRSPAPDAEPYVRVGDLVEPGKVLCIVEAMKLMNEIESEFSGRIVEIAVENTQPVEFGQILFRIEPVAT